MTSKTPVMILQELMVQRKATPEFDLSHDGGGTHEPSFQYVVRAHPVSATGWGRSKKDAKHDAARKALIKLAELGLYEPQQVDPKSQAHQNVFELDSPEKQIANFVGALKDYCVEKKLPDPIFELISDIGPPHARQFTFVASVGSIKTSATATTKKVAKQVAARNMLHCLIDTVDGGGMLVPFEDFSKYDKKANDLREEIKNMNPNLSRKISEYYCSLKELDSDLRKQALKDLQITSPDPLSQLKNILENLDISFSISNIPSADVSKIGLVIALSTDPEWVLCGFGRSYDEVEQSVAKETLDFLKIMLK